MLKNKHPIVLDALIESAKELFDAGLISEQKYNELLLLKNLNEQ